MATIIFSEQLVMTDLNFLLIIQRIDGRISAVRELYAFNISLTV
jgi:hypothetical protein